MLKLKVCWSYCATSAVQPPGGTFLATKVGYFGVKSTNVHRRGLQTPAKVGLLAATLSLLKVRRFFATKNSLPPGLCSVGGTKVG
jgi:hypothetical protein